MVAAGRGGTTGAAQDLGDVGAAPVVVGMARIALGGALLALIAWVTTRSGPTHQHPGTRRLRPHRAPWAVAAGVVAVAGYQACFFAAMERAGVALGTLVAIGSGPVFTGIVALVASRERPVPRWYPATGLAVIGCALLLAPGDDSPLDAVGLGLALGPASPTPSARWRPSPS